VARSGRVNSVALLISGIPPSYGEVGIQAEQVGARRRCFFLRVAAEAKALCSQWDEARGVGGSVQALGRSMKIPLDSGEWGGSY